MGAKLVRNIETNVERLAAAALAAAVGYAAAAFSAGDLPQPERGLFVIVAAAISFHFCRGALAAFAEREAAFAVPAFAAAEIEIDDELMLTDENRIGSAELLLSDKDRVEADELLLTEADRVGAADTLELDDILAELGPDSRVVRLFDRKAMPTPGQLKTRIDIHLDKSKPSAVQSDAAQALSDALAELRRSLR